MRLSKLSAQMTFNLKLSLFLSHVSFKTEDLPQNVNLVNLIYNCI